MRQLLVLLFLMSLAAVAQGTLTVTDRGTGTVNSSESATVIAPTSTIAAGSTGVLTFSGTNGAGNATNTPTSITDSKGNVWKRVGNTFTNSAANGGTEIAIYVGHNLTAALTSSDSLTLTYTSANITAKVWTFVEVAPTTGNIALWNGYSGQTASTGTPSRSFGSGNNVGTVIIGMVGAKSGDTFTADSDTTDGSWSTQQHTNASTTMSVTSQWKVMTAANSVQTYNPTLTSASMCTGIINVSEVSANTRGISGSGSGATTFVASPALTITTGSLGVICLAMDNTGLNGATAAADQGPITDSKGNIWTLRVNSFWDNGAASAGAEFAIYTSPITASLLNTDTITFTWVSGVSVPSKNCTFYEFATAGATYSYVSGAAAVGSNTATPTVTTSSITSGDTVIGMGAAEGGDTWVADADSSNGSWSTMDSATAGASGLNAMSGVSQYKTVTGTATQTFNPTLTIADNIVGWIAIHPTTSQSATNGFFTW